MLACLGRLPWFRGEPPDPPVPAAFGCPRSEYNSCRFWDAFLVGGWWGARRHEVL